jgi:hypothetical protein
VLPSIALDVDADAGADVGFGVGVDVAVGAAVTGEPGVEAIVASLPGSTLELVVEPSAHADTIRAAPNTRPTADDARRMFIP